MHSGFTLIRLEVHVACHLRSNPGTGRKDLIKRLQYAIAAFKRGERCRCGRPIWIIGSAEVGLSCFTCITGESEPDLDFEIDLSEHGNTASESSDRSTGTAGSRR